MKLNLSYSEFCSIVDGSILSGPSNGIVQQISYDSRKSYSKKETVFFALQGNFRDGHNFISAAHENGISCFIISKSQDHFYDDATYILVDDTLRALQKLAQSHRQKFSYPIIAIAGSIGKTTVKEWVYHFFSSKFRVSRSPKSYNSQIGVAISLLNLHEECDFALIEAGISKPGEMDNLAQMIQPDYGILTSLKLSHKDHFGSLDEMIQEQIKLFKHVKQTIISSTIQLSSSDISAINASKIVDSDFSDELLQFPFSDKGSIQSGIIAMATARFFSCLDLEAIKSLPRLALRLETFEGIDNSLIINDTYNLDLEALVYSLEHQLALAEKKKRIVIVGLDKEHLHLEELIIKQINSFTPDEIHIVHPEETPVISVKDAVVLIKGTRASEMEKFANKLKLKHHKTVLEINLSALRHNISIFKSFLLPKTKLLAMVKAQSYGAGLEKIALFLEKLGVDKLGVAYSDEGLELRKAGVKIPILVMNPEEDGFETCIRYQLEPAIYSFEQLNDLTHELIASNIQDFPIHLKFDTGMNRLGFETSDVPKLVEYIQAQPEVKIESVYSHLADADNQKDPHFTQFQISQFNLVCEELKHYFPKFCMHLLNSEGIINYSSAQLDMVRVGIGMYGISKSPEIAKKIVPVLKWKSVVSQIKTIEKGESVGYSRTFISDKSYTIAIIPLGYADGFKRSLSNGNGGVYIRGNYCPTIGRVCMDMIMVDVTGISAKVGEEVEIIGENQTLEKLAIKLETIPYEIMTSISNRVHRVYIEE